MVNATAKPSVTMIPTSLPPCRNASGIIVFASMVRIAPAAKVRTNATTPGEEPKKGVWPAGGDAAETNAIAIHTHMTRDFFQPPARSPDVAEIDSGRFEMKTAAR